MLVFSVPTQDELRQGTAWSTSGKAPKQEEAASTWAQVPSQLLRGMHLPKSTLTRYANLGLLCLTPVQIPQCAKKTSLDLTHRTVAHAAAMEHPRASEALIAITASQDLPV